MPEASVAFTELENSQVYHPQASGWRSKVTERWRLLLLCVLLAAAVIGLCVLTSVNIKTKNNLQTVKDERDALWTILTAESCTKCEPGWDLNGGRCYYFSSDKLTWDQSRSVCKIQGADLVQINSVEEQWFLDNKVGGKMIHIFDWFWIGLTDSKEAGKWLWVDDSPLKTSLSFWDKTQPDNFTGENPAGEHCAMMGAQGGATDLKSWHDRSCNVAQRRICEKAAKTG
ncbi:C-type lectin domain family 4 member E-like [Betta splendens]|uniref:C-type lectin domain family 4 member E-like n=1 Tax=Betta splendens TaxID=158456 RepID=A0A6P7NS30_BETSP|nr:C-type lectin domain family 4 member E-like [Betta splendens]